MPTLDPTAVDAMFATPPCDWWRYVPCATCNSRRNEPCRMGGGSWPKEALRPHRSRYREGLLLHGVFWLLAHHPTDVTEPPSEEEAR